MGENLIRVINIASSEEWDRIVRSFQDYDVYSLSGYVKAFALHGDGIPMLFYYQSDRLRAFNVVMKRDISDDPHFKGQLEPGVWYDLSTPYGYGGWLTEGDGELDELDRAYTDYCAAHSIVSEFVRFHPVWENADIMNGVYNVIPLGPTVAMDLSNPEIIWSNIISKNRNMIRKAQKNGIVITHGRELERFAEFKVMYNSTMDKDSAEAYYYFGDAFYESIQNDLKDQYEVFTAYYEEKPIAAAIMIYANGMLNYHLSGSDVEYRNLAPTNLLLYKAAVWGHEHGLATFHLGGGLGSHEDNLYKFKRSFYKGETKTFAIGKKIFLPNVYDELNKAREGAPESGFFPAYRRPAL